MKLFYFSAKSLDSSKAKLKDDFKICCGSIHELLNIGRWIGIAENVPNRSRHQNFWFHYLLPGIILMMLSTEAILNIVCIDFVQNLSVLTLNVVSTYSAYIGRVTAMILIIMSIFKSNHFHSYILIWECPITNNLLKPYQTELRGSIRRVLVSLTILILLFSLFVDILNVLNMKSSINKLWFVLRACTVIVECGVSFYFLYLCAALCIGLTFAFRSLSDKMKLIFLLKFESHKNSTQYSIWRLRQMHQTLCDLVANTNKFLSPNLTIVIVSQASSICFNLYTATVVLHSHHVPQMRFLLVVCCMLIRFSTIAMVCVSADRLTKQAAAGLQYIHTASWLTLPSDSHFQLSLLESKIINRPVAVTLSGFTSLNNNLLIQIVGAILTYGFVMMEHQLQSVGC